eukprot:COSAG04_NODE_9010_length_908_cov_0.791100_2_plen_88_part_00
MMQGSVGSGERGEGLGTSKKNAHLVELVLRSSKKQKGEPSRHAPTSFGPWPAAGWMQRLVMRSSGEAAAATTAASGSAASSEAIGAS